MVSKKRQSNSNGPKIQKRSRNLSNNTNRGKFNRRSNTNSKNKKNKRVKKKSHRRTFRKGFNSRLRKTKKLKKKTGTQSGGEPGKKYQSAERLRALTIVVNATYESPEFIQNKELINKKVAFMRICSRILIFEIRQIQVFVEGQINSRATETDDEKQIFFGDRFLTGVNNYVNRLINQYDSNTLVYISAFRIFKSKKFQDRIKKYTYMPKEPEKQQNLINHILFELETSFVTNLLDSEGNHPEFALNDEGDFVRLKELDWKNSNIELPSLKPALKPELPAVESNEQRSRVESFYMEMSRQPGSTTTKQNVDDQLKSFYDDVDLDGGETGKLYEEIKPGDVHAPAPGASEAGAPENTEHKQQYVYENDKDISGYGTVLPIPQSDYNFVKFSNNPYVAPVYQEVQFRYERTGQGSGSTHQPIYEPFPYDQCPVMPVEEDLYSEGPGDQAEKEPTYGPGGEILPKKKPPITPPPKRAANEFANLTYDTLSNPSNDILQKHNLVYSEYPRGKLRPLPLPPPLPPKISRLEKIVKKQKFSLAKKDAESGEASKSMNGFSIKQPHKLGILATGFTNWNLKRSSPGLKNRDNYVADFLAKMDVVRERDYEFDVTGQPIYEEVPGEEELKKKTEALLIILFMDLDKGLVPESNITPLNYNEIQQFLYVIMYHLIREYKPELIIDTINDLSDSVFNDTKGMEFERKSMIINLMYSIAITVLNDILEQHSYIDSKKRNPTLLCYLYVNELHQNDREKRLNTRVAIKTANKLAVETPDSGVAMKELAKVLKIILENDKYGLSTLIEDELETKQKALKLKCVNLKNEILGAHLDKIIGYFNERNTGDKEILLMDYFFLIFRNTEETCYGRKTFSSHVNAKNINSRPISDEDITGCIKEMIGKMGDTEGEIGLFNNKVLLYTAALKSAEMIFDFALYYRLSSEPDLLVRDPSSIIQNDFYMGNSFPFVDPKDKKQKEAAIKIFQKLINAIKKDIPEPFIKKLREKHGHKINYYESGML